MKHLKKSTKPSVSKLLFSKKERCQKWLELSNASELVKKNSVVFNGLLNLNAEGDICYKISLDLARTFKESTFKPEKQASLEKVLKCYAILNPEVGYCQGMNFVAGVIVANLPEEEAFWVFVQMMKKYGMASLFCEGFTGLYVKLEKFELFLKENLPTLASHMQKESVHGDMFVTKWFLTLFGCKLSLESTTLVMDLFFQMGWSIIYAISLALLKHFKDNLTRLPQEDILVFLETAPEKIPIKTLLREALLFLPVVPSD